MRKMMLVALVVVGLLWTHPILGQSSSNVADGEDSHGQRRANKGDPSRGMVCAPEPRIRAIVREVIDAKDSGFVELKALKEWEGNLYFKKGSEIFRFLYGRAQIPGCFDVRLDRTQNAVWSRSFYHRVGPYAFDCFFWGGYYHCNTDARSYSGNKKLDQWLLEIKDRAETADRSITPKP